MPTTRVIKQKDVVETKTVVIEVNTEPVEKKPAAISVQKKPPSISQLKVTPGKTRASSCPRRIHRNQCEVMKTEEGTVCSTRSERKARSSFTAPKTTLSSSKSVVLCQYSTSPKSRITSKCDKPAQQGLNGERISRNMSRYAIQSHNAFTVIPPNPKKRTEIKQKAEAELAALEDLRLSRAIPYVSIEPSSVGGCLSLEEVRLKQQLDMQARRRQRQL